jgi:hypothetical protein
VAAPDGKAVAPRPSKAAPVMRSAVNGRLRKLLSGISPSSAVNVFVNAEQNLLEDIWRQRRHRVKIG